MFCIFVRMFCAVHNFQHFVIFDSFVTILIIAEMHKIELLPTLRFLHRIQRRKQKHQLRFNEENKLSLPGLQLKFVHI